MKIIDSLKDYLRSAKTELEKISWPSREQTVRYSAIVLGVSVVIGVFFAGLDYGLNSLVDAALTRQAATVNQEAQPSTNVTSPEQPSVTVTSGTAPLFAPTTTPTP